MLLRLSIFRLQGDGSTLQVQLIPLQPRNLPAPHARVVSQLNNGPKVRRAMIQQSLVFLLEVRVLFQEGSRPTAQTQCPTGGFAKGDTQDLINLRNMATQPRLSAPVGCPWYRPFSDFVGKTKSRINQDEAKAGQRRKPSRPRWCEREPWLGGRSGSLEGLKEIVGFSAGHDGPNR